MKSNLLVLCLVLFMSCQPQEEPLPDLMEESRSVVLLQDDPHLQALVSRLGNLKNARTTSLLSEVDFDLAHKTHNEASGMTHYSFSMQWGSGLKMRKFILTEKPSGDINGVVFEYEVDELWLASQDSFPGWHEYSGHFRLLNLSGEMEMEMEVIGGKGTSSAPANGRTAGICVPKMEMELVGYIGHPDYGLEPKYEYSTTLICYDFGGGSGTDGESSEGPTGGSNDGETIGSGGADDPMSKEDYKPPCGPGKIRNEYDVCVSVCAPDETWDGTACLSEEEMWEDKIDDANLKPCMQTILSDLKKLNQGVGQIVAQFAGNTPGYNWIVQDGALGTGINAQTSTKYNTLTGSVSTTFDSQKFLFSTDLSIARTILHEAIHAYVVSVHYNEFSASGRAQLLGPNWVNALIDHGHPFIASDFISKISSALEEYGSNQGYSLTSQFYTDLAWGGLTHYDPSNSGNYIETPWFQAAVSSATDRARIVNTINSEYHGTNLSKGTHAGC